MYLLFLFLGFMPYYSSLILFQKLHKNTRNVSSPHSITRRRRRTRRATASRRAPPSPPTRPCRTTTRSRTRMARPSRSRSSTDTRSRPRPENTRNEQMNECENCSLAEVLTLRHESRIFGQWSNPVSGSRKSQASSPWSKQHRAPPVPSWRNHIQGGWGG